MSIITILTYLPHNYFNIFTTKYMKRIDKINPNRSSNVFLALSQWSVLHTPWGRLTSLCRAML